MYEYNVVVEDERVHDQECEVNEKGQEVADKPAGGSLSIVAVELEDVAVIVLDRKVDDANKGEVEHGTDSVPGNEAAEKGWEAVHFLLRDIAAIHEEEHHKCV